MLANKKFNATTYQDLFKLADEVWRANGGTTNVPTVVAAAKAVEAPASTPSSTPQVAAIARGRGRGARGNRGRGRGTYNNNGNRQNSNNATSQSTSSNGQKPHQKGPKASSDVPADACARHWKEGRQATYCSDPLVCSWAHIIVPRK